MKAKEHTQVGLVFSAPFTFHFQIPSSNMTDAIPRMMQGTDSSTGMQRMLRSKHLTCSFHILKEMSTAITKARGT